MSINASDEGTKLAQRAHGAGIVLVCHSFGFADHKTLPGLELKLNITIFAHIIMTKYKTKKVPKRLQRAHVPAINLVDEIKLATEMLKKQRTTDNVELEYALVTTTKSTDLRDVNDEFVREYQFSEQAKQAALKVIPKAEELGIPTVIPKTYKGEMIKDERQMAKIRDSLKNKKDSIEQSEKMKKLRELKKMGKKIQQEVLRKRSKDKKEFLEKVKRKPASELFDD